MGRALNILAPPRLGGSFRWLIASSWAANLSDGVAIAAGPLLVASLTREPLLIALAALVQWLPPLVFALPAGTLSDRLDRRRLILAVNAVRVVVLAALTTAVATDHLTIAGALIGLFALGTAEVFVDNTTSTLLPMLVARDDLAIANARLATGSITLNRLAGPPLGAAAFAAGHAWPFLGQVVLVAAAALLVGRVALPQHGAAPGEERRFARDVVEGVRWTVRHPAVRTLVLTIFIFNITFGAAWSVLVLYAHERLGLGAIGFGLLTTASALGGLVGTVLYSRIVGLVTLGTLMRIGLIYETLTHLGLAVTTSPAVALAIFVFFGLHEFVWGATSATIRQRVVPTELQGRVGAVYTVGVCGGLVAGSGIGGVLAQIFDVTAPFYFAFAGSALFVVAIWRQLTTLDGG